MTAMALGSSRARALLLLVIVAVPAVSCTDNTVSTMTAPGPRAAAMASILRRDFGSTLHSGPNTASDQLSRMAPGFAGAVVADGALTVYLTRASNSPQGRSVAQSAVEALFRSSRRPMMPVRFREAAYSFADLRAWERTLRNEYRRFNVREAQVDEVNNQLAVAVATTVDATALRAELGSLGIPSSAVDVTVERSPVMPLAALSDRVRPAGGGLSILTMFRYSGQDYRYFCTYGFNAQIDDGTGTRYVVTNAHCVEPEYVFGGLDGATVAQPDSNLSSLVGYVTANPPSQSGIVGCAAGDSCRESDAVLVQADEGSFPTSSWDIGGIEKTTFRGVGPRSSGSTTINGRISLVDATSTFFVGDTLEKIGATTGWTAGVVTGTCVYHSDGVGGGRMCNGVVAAGANHGDSGSPVIWRDSQGGYHLIGILWGGPDAVQGGQNSSEIWFSRWDGIKDDLSPYHDLLVTPNSGYTCVPAPGQQCSQ